MQLFRYNELVLLEHTVSVYKPNGLASAVGAVEEAAVVVIEAVAVAAAAAAASAAT
jgi:hypothetical protein